MKFRVIGSSRETGARMTLEFEAQSKAAAERKAQQAGMAVNRVEVFSEASDDAPVPVVGSNGNARWIRILVLLAIGTAAYYWLHTHGIIR